MPTQLMSLCSSMFTLAFALGCAAELEPTATTDDALRTCDPEIAEAMDGVRYYDLERRDGRLRRIAHEFEYDEDLGIALAHEDTCRRYAGYSERNQQYFCDRAERSAGFRTRGSTRFVEVNAGTCGCGCPTRSEIPEPRGDLEFYHGYFGTGGRVECRLRGSDEWQINCGDRFAAGDVIEVQAVVEEDRNGTPLYDVTWQGFGSAARLTGSQQYEVSFEIHRNSGLDATFTQR